jgi:hypothetical protein
MSTISGVFDVSLVTLYVDCWLKAKRCWVFLLTSP